MKIAVIAKYVPWPPNSGDKRRTLAVVRALQALGPVTVFAFEGADEDAAGLRSQGFQVEALPDDRNPLLLVQGLLRTQSLTAARFWSPAMARRIEERSGAGIDVIIVEHVQLSHYARHAAAKFAAVDMHNVESSLVSRYAASHRGPKRLLLALEAKLLARLERRASAFDLVVTASHHDDALLQLSPGPAERVVVPNAYDAVGPLLPSVGKVVIFVALLSWAPNVQAAEWFCDEVWPHVVAQEPGALLLLVGRNPSDRVRALKGPTVVVTGTVEDLEPYYAGARLSVAPLLTGGGSRLKILESLAYARPVVATTIGAEGLEDLVGRGVAIADTPAAQASQIIRWLQDSEASSLQGRLGAAAVREDHSWDAATRPLLRMIKGVKDR